MLQALQNQKRVLRKSIHSVIHSLENIQEQSRAVTTKILLLPEFHSCTRVSCYLSMPSGELDTSEIVTTILASSDKSLFVPKISQNGAMELLKLDNQNDLDTLPSGKWGIREPSYESEAGSRLNAIDAGLDLILVPGVAFDRSMSRLGHGKGYYDRYIARYIASGRPRPLLGEHFKVGLGLRDQLLDTAIPVEEHDYKMDMIVTPDEVLHR
ncbi:5-formyltetrahydrofolate cyclo-ligase [Lentinula detonsa]|uniref:5-formyltetrahydrofolate cyclo-ligase n=1 Tax=Lentinula detonsa TaxID=2804962 RepID=A0A9W8TZV6_9AGAR|nr:5-formyltetrahydrofolate cyclo-ligase [Lentinula detonsa]